MKRIILSMASHGATHRPRSSLFVYHILQQKLIRIGAAAWLALIVSGCALTHVDTEPAVSSMEAPAASVVVNGSPATTLVLALYPDVPRFDQFTTTIQQAWQTYYPGVALEILPKDAWDGGYSMDPPENVDVYVFDAMFLSYFFSQGWISPIPKNSVGDLSDFLSYALTGVESGNNLLAIPFLGCANMLFYRKSDAVLAAATTLTEVNQALGQCSFTSQIPPDERGLMVDLAGGTTTASFYVDAEQAITGQFPINLPWTPAEVDASAISSLHTMLLMASYWNGTRKVSVDYQRSQWFGDGYGRAVVAFTEGMSAMGEAGRSQVALKVMPVSDNADSTALFYSDVAAVHPNAISRGVGPLAIDLANLLTSSANLIASIGPDGSGTAQYLMPVRKSVFTALGADNPLYIQMYDVVQSCTPSAPMGQI